MRNLICIFAIVIMLFSCKENNAETTVMDTETEQPSIDGVWELVSYYNYDDNEVTDTVISREGYRQVKMYTDGKVMWSRRVPSDSIEYFGYGSYVISDSTLTETLDYGSTAMLRIIDTMRIFTFELHLGKNTFSQIDLDPEGDRIFSENYQRLKPKN